MKALSAAITVAALVWGSALASAQCPSSGGAAGGAPGPGIPGGPGPGAGRKPTFEVVLKYYWKSLEIKPSALKTALEKVKGVESVVLPAHTRTAVIQFSGKCEQLGSLETAAQNAGVHALVQNHVHVVVGIKALKGADLKGAVAELAVVPGVHGINPAPSGLELHSDLQTLTLANLRTAAAKFNCEIIVNQTFEYVTYKVVEGGTWEFVTAAEAIKGVLVVRDDGEGVAGLWINKTMVKAEQLETLQGFKVERR